jgi:hypothetical protein
VGPRYQSGTAQKVSPPLGFNPRTFQPIANDCRLPFIIGIVSICIISLVVYSGKMMVSGKDIRLVLIWYS